MSLGMFVFELSSLPFQDSQRQTGWRHASTNRVGDRPAHQYLGPDEDTRTLSGVLYPELTGGPPSLDELEKMAHEGKAWPLVDGMGYVLGNWVIEQLTQTGSVLFDDGVARKIDFQITLKRVDDGQSTEGSTSQISDWLGLFG